MIKEQTAPLSNKLYYLLVVLFLHTRTNGLHYYFLPVLLAMTGESLERTERNGGSKKALQLFSHLFVFSGNLMFPFAHKFPYNPLPKRWLVVGFTGW